MSDQQQWPFEVAGTAFSAVRFEHPRPHWRLKIEETGKILDPGTGGISSESRPKMMQDLEYLLARISNGDAADFRKRWGLPPLTARQRFNSGFHDGAADAGRGRNPEWKPGEHPDPMYVAGYFSGKDAYRRHGRHPDSSDEGWAIHAQGEWSGRIHPFIVQTEGDGDDMELTGANIPEAQLEALLSQPGVIYARNQDGTMIELSLDMDFETPVAHAVEMTRHGPVPLNTTAAPEDQAESSFQP